MLTVLRPTYTIQVVIKDPTDVGRLPVHWNGLTGKTGCDEVLAMVMTALQDAGIAAEVLFQSFEHRA
jgi:hypothetical protein